MGEFLREFINVFGKSPLVAIRRLPKALSVLRAALKATSVASPKFPIRLQLEVTNRCNYRCIMCDRENWVAIGKKLDDVMDFDTFKKLTDEIAPMYMTLNGWGEPLMNRDMPKIIEWCHNRQITSAMPTNLGFINDELFEKLILHLPTILTISMHGATKETYEAITKTKTYDRFLHYFEKLLSRTGKDRLRILCALQAKNLGEFEAFYQFLKKWGMLEKFNLICVFDFRTPAPEEQRVIPTQEEKARTLKALESAIADSDTEEKKRFLQTWRERLLEIESFEAVHEDGPCFIPWISTFILANGDVLPCCYLTGGIHKMGNIHERSFTEIWNSELYRTFRSRISNDRANLEGCKNCPRNDSRRLRRYSLLIGGLRRSGWKKGS